MRNILLRLLCLFNCLHSCLQPIDVIKTRLQLDRAGHYKGILHCGNTTVTNEGVRALWKGLTPFATHLTLKYALRMGSNAVIQSAFKDANTGKISDGGRFVSGFGAGVIEALVILTPFEVVKIRLQQQKGLAQDLLNLPPLDFEAHNTSLVSGAGTSGVQEAISMAEKQSSSLVQ
ncbi:hypothetical protein LXL04_017716 [Taraxacum kok-saghyz]